MIVWIDNIAIHLAPFSDVLHIVDGVGTKNMDRYSTIKVGNISNTFGIGIYNVVVWRLNIASHGALFLNTLPIVDGGGISNNATDNIVKFIQSKYRNGSKHMSNLSMDLQLVYSRPNIFPRSPQSPPFPPH